MVETTTSYDTDLQETFYQKIEKQFEQREARFKGDERFSHPLTLQEAQIAAFGSTLTWATDQPEYHQRITEFLDAITEWADCNTQNINLAL